MSPVNSYVQAEAIHRAINFGTQYRMDAEQYGRPEHWVEAGRYGDCEDYALAKRARLLAAGWPSDRLALCTCVTEGGVGHCVLFVDTDRGGYILDNRYEWPKRPTELPYQWQACLQEGVWRELVGWSSAQG